MDLLVALKSGDELAFKQVFYSHKEKVFNYFLKKTSSVPDAEDLLQNTFLRLWKYRAALNENYLLDMHLFNIARTVFIDYARHQNKLKKMAAQLAAESHPENIFFNNGLDKEKLNSVLSAMPQIRKKIFIMNKIEGYSYKEIADELSLNVKAVDNHVARALKRIRKALLLLFIF